MPSFALELENLAGVSRGELRARAIKLKRTVNDSLQLEFEADSYDENTPELVQGLRAARLWRDGQLRFRGRIREPFTRSPGTVKATAGGPVSLFDRRKLQSLVTMNGDATAAYAALLVAERLRGETNLVSGVLDPSTPRTGLAFEPGTSMRDVLDALANADGGFFWQEEPQLDPLDVTAFCRLDLKYPDAGEGVSGLVFEYGDDTIGNLSGFQIDEKLPSNAITADAGGRTDVVIAAQRVTDAASIAAYGLLEEYLPAKDVQSAAMLQSVALDALRPSPVLQISVTPLTADAADTNGVYVPRLFDDFDVGDIGLVSINDGATQLENVIVRVNSATISVSDQGKAEDLTEVVLQVLS